MATDRPDDNPDQVLPAAKRTAPTVDRDKPISLRPQHERFAQLVASGWSQAAAYRAAIARPDTLPTTIYPMASAMASDPHVSARIDQLRTAAAREAAAIFGESRAAIVRHNVALATADARRLFHEDGRARKPHELDDDIAQAVESVEVDPDGRIKYKLARKTSALDMVNRIAGLYEADNRQQAGGIADALRALAGGSPTAARIAPPAES